MHCCCAGVDEGRGESAGYEPEMGRREEGKDEGAVVEEAGEEGVCTLKMLAEWPFTLLCLRRLTLRGYTQTPKAASLSRTTAVTSCVPVELVLLNAFTQTEEAYKPNAMPKILNQEAISLCNSRRCNTAS